MCSIAATLMVGHLLDLRSAIENTPSVSRARLMISPAEGRHRPLAVGPRCYRMITSQRPGTAKRRPAFPLVTVLTTRRRVGGQGRGRTADLPLFRATAACSVAFRAVRIPWSRRPEDLNGCWRTVTNETKNET